MIKKIKKIFIALFFLRILKFMKQKKHFEIDGLRVGRPQILNRAEVIMK